MAKLINFLFNLESWYGMVWTRHYFKVERSNFLVPLVGLVSLTPSTLLTSVPRMGLLTIYFVKQQFKGLSVCVGVCGKCFLSLSTRELLSYRAPQGYMRRGQVKTNQCVQQYLTQSKVSISLPQIVQG